MNIYKDTIKEKTKSISIPYIMTSVLISSMIELL
jgi:hypothetical protein